MEFSPIDSTIILSTKDTATGVRLETQDEGPSVKEKERQMLFREFANLSNKPTGKERSFGLGLSIVKKLIEEQGGSVGANFPDGNGSIFWFELPKKKRRLA